MIDMNSLKPCPFCNKKPVLIDNYSIDRQADYLYTLKCPANCDIWVKGNFEECLPEVWDSLVNRIQNDLQKEEDRNED